MLLRKKLKGVVTMEQAYRYDPYTGQPLRKDNAYPPPAQQQPAQNQQRPTQAGFQPGVIVRPVASYDEAKAIPTDFAGALTIMPDWAHGYIYAKALGDNGTPVFRAYHYEPPEPAAEPTPAVAYAPLEALERLQGEVTALRQELEAAKGSSKDHVGKTSGKGDKT